MRRVMLFGVGLLVGAAVGAAVVTLLTPASGDDMRKRVEDHVRHAQSEARLAAEARRREMEAQLTALTKPNRAK